MQGNSLNECAKSVFGLRDGSIAPVLRDISDQFSVTGQPLATTLAAYCCDVGHLFIVSIGRRVGGPRRAVRKRTVDEFKLKKRLSVAVLELKAYAPGSTLAGQHIEGCTFQSCLGSELVHAPPI